MSSRSSLHSLLLGGLAFLCLQTATQVARAGDGGIPEAIIMEEPGPPAGPEDVRLLSAYYTAAAVTIIAETPGKMDGITDAVCRAFRASVKSPHSQATSAFSVIKGAADPAESSSIGKGASVQAVVRGIETCLDEKLDYEVAMVVKAYIAASNVDIPPNYQAYRPPVRPDDTVDPGFDTDTCVSNCIDSL